MTRMAQTERSELCDVALQVGPDEPTLCGEWTVRELVAHLLVREGHPAALGVGGGPLSDFADRATERIARRDFRVLVEAVRNGPPLYSPFVLPPVDAIANSLEFFIHHEDIRRAQPGWEPRSLPPGHENLLWRQLRFVGKGLVRKAPVGVVIEREDTGDRRTLRDEIPTVVVRGMPSELALFLYGRQAQSRATLEGPADAVAALEDADLGG